MYINEGKFTGRSENRPIQFTQIVNTYFRHKIRLNNAVKFVPYIWTCPLLQLTWLIRSLASFQHNYCVVLMMTTAEPTSLSQTSKLNANGFIWLAQGIWVSTKTTISDLLFLSCLLSSRFIQVTQWYHRFVLKRPHHSVEFRVIQNKVYVSTCAQTHEQTDFQWHDNEIFKSSRRVYQFLKV